MYTLLTRSDARDLWIEHVPLLALSLVTAELFFKFHSFTLECLAFLATWAAADFLFVQARRIASRSR